MMPLRALQGGAVCEQPQFRADEKSRDDHETLTVPNSSHFIYILPSPNRDKENLYCNLISQCCY